MKAIAWAALVELFLSNRQSAPLVLEKIMSVQALVEDEAQTIPLPQRLILPGTTWQTYQNLLNTFDERGNVRLAYDAGVLEIMTKSEYHEIYSNRLARMVEALERVCELKFDRQSEH
ncbi:MAG: hypothetical protein HY231_16275 [Acidobacteria bacterium]|nr:hypothetical protein [Acidobacteriota bacterium]